MHRQDPKEPRELDVAVVGAGLGGLYALYRLRKMGLETKVFEAGSGIGGTWFWNRYPGARCDVESLAYSYHFSAELEQEWHWQERYASQPEILRYANHVADRFDLRRDIELECQVLSATFDEGAERWLLETSQGDAIRARFCVMATGCLSARNTPDFPGLERFRGAHFHTGDWPEGGAELEGKRVGIIGTGSTGIQSIPILAEQVGELFVFQRTPNFSVPSGNAPMDPEYEQRVKSDYGAFREPFLSGSFGLDFNPSANLGVHASDEERRVVFEERWKHGGLGFIGAFADSMTDFDVNEAGAEFIREKIREIVADPETARALAPHTAVGCKRPCADDGYYETFNRPNVHLVDIRGRPITEITEHGLRVGEHHFELDVLIFATGFDAMTGALLRIDPQGRGGLRLSDEWKDGPRTFLGLAMAGFPNLFALTGPGSPSVLANMIPALEQHVDWVADCIAFMKEHGHRVIETLPEEQERWMEIVHERADRTVYPTCNSWYMGANIPGKARGFMVFLGFGAYVEHCNAVVEKGYAGFRFDASAGT